MEEVWLSGDWTLSTVMITMVYTWRLVSHPRINPVPDQHRCLLTNVAVGRHRIPAFDRLGGSPGEVTSV